MIVSVEDDCYICGEETSIDIDPSDYIYDIEDDELIDEIESRGFLIHGKGIYAQKLALLSQDPTELKRELCDVIGLNYHAPTKEIIKQITNILNSKRCIQEKS